MKHLSRRDTLKLGLAATLMPTSVGAQENSPSQADIIVIGAGMAGLAAANALRNNGADVLVLEASNRVGGRIHTDRSLGMPVEMGAGWIHGPRGNPLSDLARQAQLETYVTDDDSFVLLEADGRAVSDRAFVDGEARLDRLMRTIDNGLEADTSLAQAVRAFGPDVFDDPVTRWMLSSYVEFAIGGPLEDISAFYWDEGESFSGADVILPAGYDSLLPRLGDGLDIRFQHRVEKIVYGENGAQVLTSQGRFAARQVICTLPLGVLQADAVAFDPPLPSAHRTSIDRLGFGQVSKLVLQFDRPFWPRDVQYFGVMTGPLGRWNTLMNLITYGSVPLLLGISLGNYATRADAMSKSDAVADMMTVLRGAFGNDLPNPVAAIKSDWSSNPFARGTYSFIKTGSTPVDFDRFSQAVGPIHFAGEHTQFAHYGTVHGAYLSGLRAADNVS